MNKHLFVVLLFFVCLSFLTCAKQTKSSPLNDDEEVSLLAALMGNASSSEKDEAVERSHYYQQVIAEQRNGETSTKSKKKDEIDKIVLTTNKNNSNAVDETKYSNVWTLIKKQILEDLSPILNFIPSSLKKNVAVWSKEAKIDLLNILYGILTPTLVTTSKTLKQMSVGIDMLVNMIETHRSKPQLIPRNSPSTKSSLLERAERKLKSKKMKINQKLDPARSTTANAAAQPTSQEETAERDVVIEI